MVCRWQDRCRAKYVLKHSARVLVTDDEAYNCIGFKQDADGMRYVHIVAKDVLKAAGKAVRAVFTKLGPKILPFGELVSCTCPSHGASVAFCSQAVRPQYACTSCSGG